MNNAHNLSRDSISSHQGDESIRYSLNSSCFSRNKFNTDKKISIDKRVFNKLITFLKFVVKELKLEEGDLHAQMIEEFMQTDGDGMKGQRNVNNFQSSIEGDNIFVNEQEQEETTSVKYKENIEKLEKENAEYKANMNNMNNDNKDLSEQIRKLNNLLEEINKEKDNLCKELEKIKSASELHKEINIDKNENISSQFNNINIDVNKELKSSLSIFEDSNNKEVVKQVTKFLSPKDFFNFYHTSKTIHNTLITQSETYLKSAIETKNKQLNNLISEDWFKDLEITEPEVERLIREYIQNNQLPGLDLKNLLVKSLHYIDKDIKKALGIVSSSTTGKRSSILGSINDMFNRIVNKESSNKSASSRKSITQFETGNLNEIDKFLVTENLVNNDLNVEFDFKDSEEIKTLLVEFFTTLKKSPQKISHFISELINEYSDFIFYSQKTLMEIRELDIVKSAMHERFKKYHKICFELEGELEDLQKFARTNKEIKEILMKQKQEVEVKYTDSMTQITFLKDELNKTSNKMMTISEKYNRIEIEYESFKSKLIKEFKSLKNEYDNANSERNVLKDAIFEFKRYFMRFHITEEGDIAYIEDV